MEKLRNLISNLYVYRFQNNNNNNNNNNNFYNNINNVSNINPINFSGNDDLADDYEIINNLNINKKQSNNSINNNNKLNKNNFNNNNTLTNDNKNLNNFEKPYQSLTKENIDIYNSNNNINKNNKLTAKKTMKEEINKNNNNINNNNNFMIKSGINYVVRNKELIKEKEWKMREERLKKENDALHLLLSHKPKPNNVKSKLFDYQEKQSKIKKVGNFNNRSHSSNGNKKLINGIKKYNMNYYNNINDDYNNDYNEIVLNNYDLKYYKNLAGNLILPKIKPETSPLANIQENEESILKDKINEKNLIEENNFKNNNNNINNNIIKDDYEEKINDIKKTLQQQNKNTKFMTEEEKKEKINELNNRKKDLEIELFKLPIARLSKRQIERKSEIEKSLDNIDNELNKLSYIKVPLKI